MIGSKYLSELVDCSTFQKGKLNLIEAPTGCGKTAFALKRIPALIKNALFKVIFLIDTINGREQIKSIYHTMSPSPNWQKCVETEMIDFMNDGRIVAMTYAKFGKMCEEDAFFVDKLDYIICDELPSLLVFKGIKSKKPEHNTTFHKTAKNEIVRAIKRGDATVIALTATPKRIYRDMCDCVINPIKVDTEQLIQFETKKTINYNSLNAVFDKVSKGEIGLCYAHLIGTMQRIEAMAVTAGLSPICIWSISNEDHIMTEEQLAVRKEVLENSRIPPQYNLLIINASSETSIKIKSRVDYVIAHTGSEDSKIQARGRVNSDLERLYVLSDEACEIEVPEEFLGKKLFAEDKEALCKALSIFKPGKKEIYAWTGVKKRLIEVGYVLTKGRENNKRYIRITLPE